jgi:hypothetical protein
VFGFISARLVFKNQNPERNLKACGYGIAVTGAQPKGLRLQGIRLATLI